MNPEEILYFSKEYIKNLLFINDIKPESHEKNLFQTFIILNKSGSLKLDNTCFEHIPIEEYTFEIFNKYINIECPLVPYKYNKNFYDKNNSLQIFNYLKTLNYKHTYYRMFGKITRSPRKMIWYSTNLSWTYFFSKNHIKGLPVNKFTPELLKIKKEVETFTGKTFNSLLINEYHPNDSISWHSDNDPWLGENFIVPSLSFGSERTFKLRLKSDKKKQFKIKLKNGSLIIMLDKCQNLWEHSIPKEKIQGIRYNLTFRNIIPSLVNKQYKGIKLENIDINKIKAGKQYLSEI